MTTNRLGPSPRAGIISPNKTGFFHSSARPTVSSRVLSKGHADKAQTVLHGHRGVSLGGHTHPHTKPNSTTVTKQCCNGALAIFRSMTPTKHLAFAWHLCVRSEAHTSLLGSPTEARLHKLVESQLSKGPNLDWQTNRTACYWHVSVCCLVVTFLR